MRALLLTRDFPADATAAAAGRYDPLARGLDAPLAVLAPLGDAPHELEERPAFRIHRRPMPIVPPRVANGRSANGRSAAAALRLPRRAWNGLMQLRLFYRHARTIVRRERIDLVLIDGPGLSLVGPRLRRRADVRYGVLLRAADLDAPGRTWPLIDRRILRALDRADVLIVDSDRTRRRWLERGVRLDQRFLHVPPGVDTTYFRPDAGDPDEVRRRHRLGDRPVLLAIGPPGASARHDRVIRALPAIVERVPEAVFLIVGAGPDRAELEALARERDVEGHVTFADAAGPDGRRSYYRAADLLAVPGSEPAIAILEAAACGLPAIGPAAPDAAESIEDGVTGFRVDPDDPAAFTDRAVRLLTDPELARRFGRAGRDRAVQRFDRARQAERLAERLTRLLERGPGAAG